MVERHRYRQDVERKHYFCDLINQSNQLLFVDKWTNQMTLSFFKLYPLQKNFNDDI
jgi:hypothetical protein